MHIVHIVHIVHEVHVVHLVVHILHNWGQSCRNGTMHFLKGELEVLALNVFLLKILNLYVCHISHFIVGNLNFF